MTTQTTTQSAARAPFASLGQKLLGILEILSNGSRLAGAAKEAERLFSLSDAELARRGLKRDEIVQHVFGPYLYL